HAVTDEVRVADIQHLAQRGEAGDPFRKAVGGGIGGRLTAAGQVGQDQPEAVEAGLEPLPGAARHEPAVHEEDGGPRARFAEGKRCRDGGLVVHEAFDSRSTRQAHFPGNSARTFRNARGGGCCEALEYLIFRACPGPFPLVFTSVPQDTKCAPITADRSTNPSSNRRSRFAAGCIGGAITAGCSSWIFAIAKGCCRGCWTRSRMRSSNIAGASAPWKR